MEVLRQHDVFQRVQVRHQVKLLENEADLLRAVTHHLALGQFRQVHSVHNRVAGGQRVQPAQNIDQCGLARSRMAPSAPPIRRAGCGTITRSSARSVPYSFTSDSMRTCAFTLHLETRWQAGHLPGAAGEMRWRSKRPRLWPPKQDTQSIAAAQPRQTPLFPARLSQ